MSEPYETAEKEAERYFYALTKEPRLMWEINLYERSGEELIKAVFIAGFMKAKEKEDDI